MRVFFSGFVIISWAYTIYYIVCVFSIEPLTKIKIIFAGQVWLGSSVILSLLLNLEIIIRAMMKSCQGVPSDQLLLHENITRDEYIA